MKLDWQDVHELAADIVGLDGGASLDEVDDALLDKLDVSFEQFSRVAGALVPYATIAVGPVTGKTYQGFANNGVFIVKREYEV